MKIKKKLTMLHLSFSLAIVLTGLLLGSCDQDTLSTDRRKPKTQLVETVTLKTESGLIERKFNALVVAPNTINISNQIAGTILKMPYRAGAKVNKGDILIELDDSLTRAEQKKVLANLEKANQDLNRLKKLIPQNLASAEELSSAITEKKLTEAEVTLKSIQLERSVIKAPFSGVISQRFFEPGDSLSINQKVLTLVDNKHLVITSSVPENYISALKLDKTVNIELPAQSIVLQGKISTIYPTVDSNTQQIPIEISFEKTTNEIYPGQFAEITISYLNHENLLIPVNAVQYDTKGSWVYTVNKNNQAMLTRITTGENFKNKIEVISGLKLGDIVVSRGFVGLRPGKKINTKQKTD